MIPKDIEDKDLQNFQRLLEYFTQLAEDGVTSLIEKQLLLMLDHTIPFFANLVMTEGFYELKRITINKNVVGSNKRIYEIKYLKYPPAEKVTKYGRCNLPGQSVFYGSFLSMTALNEMRPNQGDLITESTWRLTGDQPIIYCPIFKNQPKKKDFINPRTFEINQIYERKVKDYPEKVRNQIDSLLQFVTDAFTKYVHPSNHLNYIFSAYFSNKIFNNFEDGKIEAIYYPSVKEKLSFENIALKADVFDKRYELIKVKDSIVDMDPRSGSGGYMMLGLGECKNFDYASGKILWETNELHQPKERITELKSKYGLEF
jgi:hypothetical protein